MTDNIPSPADAKNCPADVRYVPGARHRLSEGPFGHRLGDSQAEKSAGNGLSNWSEQ